MSKRTKIILIVAAVVLLLVGVIVWYRKRGQYVGQLGYGKPVGPDFTPEKSPYTYWKSNNALSAGLYVPTGVALYNQTIEEVLGWMWHIKFESMPNDGGKWAAAKDEAMKSGKTEMQWLAESAAYQAYAHQIQS